MLTMATKEISIPFGELSRLEIYCPKCEAAVLLDVTKTDGYGRITHCAACGQELSDKLKAAIVAYSRFFAEATESKSKIQFRIKAD